LAQWAFQELQKLATSLDSVTDLDIDYKAPAKPQDGMLAYADGSRWNPDAINGEGFYGYWAGAWHFLGGGGGTSSVGKHSIWIPASAMMSRTTNGAAIGSVESSTNKVMSRTLDFDKDTDEFAQFTVRMPKSWDESTVTAWFLWSSAVSGTTSVVWGLQGVALSNDDALDAAFGTAQTVTDAQTAAGDLMQSDETSAITIAGTPAELDYVVFQVYRDANNGSDDLDDDARLHGVLVVYNTNAATDD
jgi:hypothetical protein